MSALANLAAVIDDADQFGQWVIEETTLKSGIDQSPAVADDDELNDWLQNHGNLKHEFPRYDSLTRTDEEKVANEDLPIGFSGGVALAAPLGIGTHIETAVRTERSNWWSATKLAKYLNLRQDDPVQRIIDDLAGYWAFRRQAMFLAMWVGVFADNDAAPTGTEHVQGDLTLNRSNGGVFDPGVTNFTAENFIDAMQLMGDSKDSLGYIITHSVVHSTMEKNDLLDVVKDSQPGAPSMYRGKPILINDQMTKGAGNVYHTYVFGAGSTRRGIGTPDMPFELARMPTAANGAGMEVAFSRVRWCLHPHGMRFTGTPAGLGGVTNAELATGTNWLRTVPERRQIKAVRLITTES